MTPQPPTEIRNTQGERIAFSFVPGSPDRQEIVVIGHGLTSDKERPWSQGLSKALAAHGIASMRIAFSGNGESEGDFTESTISKEVEDLGAVFDALPGWRLAYIGQSMGGAVGLLRAARDERVTALVSLAAVTHTAEFIRRMFGHLEPGQPMLDKPHCPLGEALRRDLETLGTIADRAGDVRVPWLVVHGTLDEIVPPQHSIDLNEAAPERSELVLLEGVDHSFSDDGLQQMLGSVVPWLVEVLDGAGRFAR